MQLSFGPKSVQRRTGIVGPGLALLLLLLALMYGCSETVEPTDETFAPILRVEVYERPGPPLPAQLLAGATVDLIKVEPTGNVLIDSKQTALPTGAIFTDLDVLISGEIYQLEVDAGGRARTIEPFPMCSDTLIRIFYDRITVVDCDDLNIDETLVFVDDQTPPNTELVQNTPPGELSYSYFWTLSAPPGCDLQIDAGDLGLVEPFRLESINVDAVPQGGSFVLPGGRSAVFHFLVSTVNVGEFSQNAEAIRVECLCNSARGTIDLTLEATVVEPRCECEDVTSDVFDFGTVEVGSSESLVRLVFSNTLPCDVTINPPDVAAPFALAAPVLPTTLIPGANLELEFVFTPTAAGRFEETAVLRILPRGSEPGCDLTVPLEGVGCEAGCPLYVADNREDLLGERPDSVLLSTRDDERVLVEFDPPIFTSSAPSGLSHIVNRAYRLRVPETVCDDLDVTITVQDFTPNDGVDDLQYYNLEPRSFSISPGSERSVDVTFDAPTMDQLEQDVRTRGSNALTSDSTYCIVITTRTPACVQVDTVCAIVTTCPNFVPLPELFAFGQLTINQPTRADYQIFSFHDFRSSDDEAANLTPPVPLDQMPSRGDIFVTVGDRAVQNPFVGQAPTLNLRPVGLSDPLNPSTSRTTFEGFKHLDALDDIITTPELFKDVCGTVIPNFCALADFDGYDEVSVTLSPADLGKIYGFREAGGNQFGLIYINRVDDGTTQARTANVGFFVIYPVIVSDCN